MTLTPSAIQSSLPEIHSLLTKMAPYKLSLPPKALFPIFSQ